MSNKFLDLFKLWVEKAASEKDILAELKSIEKKSLEIKDRFYRDLDFGTAGMRGIIGAGTNRINVFVVGKITQAFCEYLKKTKKKSSVAISYDSRNKSLDFLKCSAQVFAANGIDVYIFREIAPVPLLSFVVRYCGFDAGVMITASHNPFQYNGYKVFGSDGCQLLEGPAKKIYDISKKLDIFSDVKKVSFSYALKEGNIKYIKKEVIDEYYKNVISCFINKDCLKDKDLNVLYTPLNGAGKRFVFDVSKKVGIKNFSFVEEQKEPDMNFTTCRTPNPETKQALSLGLEYCKEKKFDILVATDPDGDRVGVAVPLNKNKKRYLVLSGNEIGMVMFYYICTQKKALNTMPKKPVAIKTIVSSNLFEEIAKEYKVKVINVTTGFKNIGEQITKLEEKGKEDDFIFAFEESNGYLAGNYIRDKDGVCSAVLLCEIAAFYKRQNKTVAEVLKEIYKKYGYYLNKVESFVFKGQKGTEDMNKIMQGLRNDKLNKVAGVEVLRIKDYLNGTICDLKTKKEQNFRCKKENILEYSLFNKAGLIVRPSGTEPKIKIYFSVFEKDKTKATELLDKLIKNFNIKKYLK